MTASFKHLRDLHKEESGLLLKSGYGLTSKALNPSNLERQDVKLVLQVFNPHVAEALTARSGEVDFQHAAATADFIRVILRWWSIVNVKTPNKGYHHRNVYEEPMADHTDDPKARFLSAFITWLDVWEFYRHDTGVLTQETLSALRLSAQSLLALVKYCVSELHFKYVLLGKVQTDPLESRFGQYRQMAGGQYHISVRQLCETEGRIRLQNALPRMSSDDLKGIEEVHVTDVGTSCSVEVHDADLDQLRAQMPVIGYVGGYCAHAAIKVLKCKSCQGHLVITANEAETEEDSHSLITKLDRAADYAPRKVVIKGNEESHEDIFPILSGVLEAGVKDMITNIHAYQAGPTCRTQDPGRHPGHPHDPDQGPDQLTVARQRPLPQANTTYETHAKSRAAPGQKQGETQPPTESDRAKLGLALRVPERGSASAERHRRRRYARRSHDGRGDQLPARSSTIRLDGGAWSS
ncbi:hypothetical protein HPB50_013744 [Hyalomma asiaticum]|uniref:Uncharacterized protein n=1 Tax=Hyalomma asiaticum TaxID=266040 RepID=A0ACB7SEV9_HYAAI|nr:hypothetical protein HPB50_013744 [Hyalomma asiaticum]